MAKKKTSKAQKPVNRAYQVNWKEKIRCVRPGDPNDSIQLSVVIPPRIRSADNALTWLQDECCGWLEGLGHMEFVRAERKPSVVGSLTWDLCQLVRGVVLALRTGEYRSVQTHGKRWRDTLEEAVNLLDDGYMDDEGRTAKMLIESAKYYSRQEGATADD